jgi:hypothetical protein
MEIVDGKEAANRRASFSFTRVASGSSRSACPMGTSVRDLLRCP